MLRVLTIVFWVAFPLFVASLFLLDLAAGYLAAGLFGDRGFARGERGIAGGDSGVFRCHNVIRIGA